MAFMVWNVIRILLPGWYNAPYIWTVYSIILVKSFNSQRDIVSSIDVTCGLINIQDIFSVICIIVPTRLVFTTVPGTIVGWTMDCAVMTIVFYLVHSAQCWSRTMIGLQPSWYFPINHSWIILPALLFLIQHYQLSHKKMKSFKHIIFWKNLCCCQWSFTEERSVERKTFMRQ
jgi:hypothetical protein